MSSTVTLDAARSWPASNSPDFEPLLAWGQRVGEDARKGIPTLAPLRLNMSAEAAGRSKSLAEFFGTNAPDHPFSEMDTNWLWLHERQVTEMFVEFLKRADALHVLAFLRALEPERQWPDHINELHVEAEVATRKGFIDILVKCRSGVDLYGAVIEAKFGSDARRNPFRDYREYAKRYVFHGNDENVSYRVLGQKQCRRSLRIVARKDNPWQFVSWFAFLRRLDAEMGGVPSARSYAQFRRVVWEKIL